MSALEEWQRARHNVKWSFRQPPPDELGVVVGAADAAIAELQAEVERLRSRLSHWESIYPDHSYTDTTLLVHHATAEAEVERLTWMLRDCAASMYDDRYLALGDDGSMDLDGFVDAILADLARRYAEREGA